MFTEATRRQGSIIIKTNNPDNDRRCICTHNRDALAMVTDFERSARLIFMKALWNQRVQQISGIATLCLMAAAWLHRKDLRRVQQ